MGVIPLTNFTDGLAASQQRPLILHKIKLRSTSNTVEDQNITQEEVLFEASNNEKGTKSKKCNRKTLNLSSKVRVYQLRITKEETD